MEIYLPFNDFKKSLDCLEDNQLQKQKQNIKCLVDVIEQLQRQSFLGRGKIAWGTNPTTIMWENALPFLKLYYNTSLLVSHNRGLQNGQNNVFNLYPITFNGEIPWWFGKENLHLSHQNALVKLNPQVYKAKFSIDVDGSKPLLFPKVIRGKQYLCTI